MAVRLDPRHHWAALPAIRRDAILALLGAALAIGGLMLESYEWGSWAKQPDVLGIGLLGLSGGVVGLRRRHPLATGLISAGAYTLAASLGYSAWTSQLVVAGVVGAAASYASRRATLVLGLAVIGFAVGEAIYEGEIFPGELLSSLAVAIVPVVVGDAFRVRRQLAAEAVARAERVEQLRELELARAVGEERLRIARDVHDVVGHHLSAIAIQSGVGRQMLEGGEDEEALRSLRTIRDVTATALAETRRLLGLVRGRAELRAAGLPGAEEVQALVGLAEEGGLEVTVRRKGSERALEGVVGDCAYRIIQEALTNVSRHAEARNAVVELNYGPDSLEVVVEDDGVGTPDVVEGHGLIGMRERVAVARGELSVGPRAGRGWRVRAELPYESLEV